MEKILDGLRQVRASNIIFLFMIPIIIYFLATSRNYLPALHSVLGVENNATSLLISFLTVCLTATLILTGSIFLLKSVRIDQKQPIIVRSRKLAAMCFLLSFLISFAFHFNQFLDNYAVSILANSADPRKVDWIVVVNQSFTLTPEFQKALLAKVEFARYFVSIVGLGILAFALLPTTYHASRFGKLLILIILSYGFLTSFYFLMIAHAGFAVGLMITLRAAFFAYFGASVLGLLWALLTKLSPSHRATKIYTMLGIGLICLGTIFFLQKHKEVALIGTTNGKIGVISGTPQWVADTVRYGDFLDQPPEKPFKIRSLNNLSKGLSLFEKQTLSGLIVPISAVEDYSPIWTTSYLPTKQKTLGIAAVSIGFLILLLTGIGAISNLHPLAVFSDFFVDTIRGIPMIVIILYIGLPLAGALKNASGGYMNIEMLTRGIIAIAIGYSAYMAEVFRAGIEAIPKGQIEAARTLGLREHQVARFVIIPQAIAIVLPALGNEFIAMLKDTSLLSILSIRDVTQRMKEFQAQSFLAFEPFNTAALLYVFLTLLAASGIKSLDNIVNKNRISEK
ncbi:MAG: amino acid ABC transporter permease [Paracoccaceae bacterium]|nr:amino acid ABC transporter permease [Paracoccaceae bacterium]